MSFFLQDGQTALMRSCVSQHPKIAKKLLAAGGEPDHQDTVRNLVTITIGLVFNCDAL